MTAQKGSAFLLKIGDGAVPPASPAPTPKRRYGFQLRPSLMKW